MFEIGQAAQISRRFSPADVAEYVALGGAEPEKGELPEPLIGALFSYLLGVKLPGIGTSYLKQESDYLACARVGETLTARVEITRSRPHKHLADLKTTCHSEEGILICAGRALVYVADVEQ